MISKKCKSCKNDISLETFSKDKRNSDGCSAKCRKCTNEYQQIWRMVNPESNKASQKKYYREKGRSTRYKLYGITEEEFDQLIIMQDSEKCAICDYRPQLEEKSLCIDHDHVTGKVRGFLCHSCNLALGGFKDSSDLLFKAAAYLISHELLFENLNKEAVNV